MRQESDGVGAGYARHRRRLILGQIAAALGALALGFSLGYMPVWLAFSVVGGFCGLLVAKMWELFQFKIDLRDPRCTYCGTSINIGPIPVFKHEKHWYGMTHRTTILWVCRDHLEQHARVVQADQDNQT